MSGSSSDPGLSDCWEYQHVCTYTAASDLRGKVVGHGFQLLMENIKPVKHPCIASTKVRTAYTVLVQPVL
jgi:hypothetical protein